MICLWQTAEQPLLEESTGACVPTCQRDRVINHGSAAGKPKQQCRQCGYQCTRTTPRGKPLAMNVNAVLWYLRGLSMHRIAFLLRGSAQAVLDWVRAFAKEPKEKPDLRGERLSWNAMRWGILSRQSGAHSGSGKRSIATRDSCSTGSVDDGTRRPERRWSITWPNGM